RDRRHSRVARAVGGALHTTRGGCMQEWLNYFEHNRVNRLFIPWEEGANIEAHLRRPLIRSLRRFQVGESGEGRKLRRHAAQTGDPVYARAIELFVREEQEHARLMGELLRRLGA